MIPVLAPHCQGGDFDNHFVSLITMLGFISRVSRLARDTDSWSLYTYTCIFICICIYIFRFLGEALGQLPPAYDSNYGHLSIIDMLITYASREKRRR